MTISKRSDELPTYSRRELRMAKLKTERFDTHYLAGLLEEHKAKRAANPKTYSMSNELGEVMMVVVEKMIGGGKFRGYSEDWKEDFKGKAIEHLIKYSHNFSPEKCARGKNDSYNYLAMICMNAFLQSMKKVKEYAANTVSIDHDLFYNQDNWDQRTQELRMVPGIVLPEWDLK